jgi:hypothetical protein
MTTAARFLFSKIKNVRPTLTGSCSSRSAIQITHPAS